MSFLASKVALVTGGSGTIGQAIAKGLLQQGAAVCLVGRRVEALEKAQQHLSSYGSVSYVSCDISNEESVVDLYMTMDEQYGRIDLLINNDYFFSMSFDSICSW